MSKSWFSGSITCPMCNEVVVTTAAGSEHASGPKDHAVGSSNPGAPSIDKGDMKGHVSSYGTRAK